MWNAAETPQRLDDFEILRELGRGGMGVVYEAQQISLKRRVALKVLASMLSVYPNAVARFNREAEAAAKLHHTNIVPIYSTGEENGIYYYAMEYVDGPSLDALIKYLAKAPSFDQAWQEAKAAVDSLPDRSPLGASGSTANLGASNDSEGATTTPSQLPRRQKLTAAPREVPATRHLPSDSEYFDRVARALSDIASALQHAHDHGVIHRDVKPSNLLLGPDGRLSITDFGLARLIEEPGMTVSGEILGSPAYMSPEQVKAGREGLDHRTDIYSLGATLYELLTLRPLFTGEHRDEILSQITLKEPPPPRQINRSVPVDLETICLKALGKDPNDRYQSGRDLAEDLRRFVERRAINARRTGPVTKCLKWSRRHKAITFLAISLTMVIFVAGLLTYRVWQAEKEVAQFIAQLESRDREVFEKRRGIVAACGIRPGMGVGDIGAGTGLFTELFAAAVGPQGQVYAVDISAGLVRYVEKRTRSLGLGNVSCVRCSEFSVELPPQSIDLAFICDTYRYFENPQRNLRSVHEALRPQGQVVVIDLRDESASADGSVNGSGQVAWQRVVEEVEAVGFRLVGVEELLEESYFLRFEKI